MKLLQYLVCEEQKLELEQDTIEKYLGYIWVLMIVALGAGLYLHQATAAAWQMWWAVWLCEIFTYALYALFFTFKTPSTALAVAIGSIVWYINQRSTSYAGENIIYILTFVASGMLVWYAWARREDTNIPFVSQSDVNAFGIVAQIVMMLFAFGKMLSWIPWRSNVAAFTSAEAWSFGQLLISLGSLLALVKLKEYRSAPLYIAVLGLLIAMYAALVYGWALTLL